jgi:hypothetical protein
LIVVIPSNREINLAYLEPLIAAGARFVVVDDTAGSIRIDHPRFEVYTWADRERMLGPLDVGFPRRNGASRDFGFLVAWRNSDPDEIIVALDDDCEVDLPDFAEKVEWALSTRQLPVATCGGTHLNFLGLYEGVSEHLFPRGFPYSARGGDHQIRLETPRTVTPAFNLGLWRGVFDVNAIDKINGPAYTHPDAALRVPAVVVERGRLVSVCSMNMQFRRFLVPAVYQLPMHVEVLPHWVVDRYGDIWGGFILKSLMDVRGDAMAVGVPVIHHRKDGTHVRNTWQEHVCHLVNDEFLQLLAEALDGLRPASYLEMMRHLGEEFGRVRHKSSPLLGPYLDHLHVAMRAWCEALSIGS